MNVISSELELLLTLLRKNKVHSASFGANGELIGVEFVANAHIDPSLHVQDKKTVPAFAATQNQLRDAILKGNK